MKHSDYHFEVDNESTTAANIVMLQEKASVEQHGPNTPADLNGEYNPLDRMCVHETTAYFRTRATEYKNSENLY